MKQLKNILKVEYALLAILIYVAYLESGFAWYWPFALFLLFDISMIGYSLNTRMGALIYNTVHSAALPALTLALFFIFQHEILLFISLIWLFHITIDRACGYGLKYSDDFHHTHLGSIKRQE